MTRAVTLAEIAEGDILNIDGTNNRVGIGTTNPQALLQVGTGVSVYGNSGIVSATTFRVPDNGKFTAGAGDDLQIYHDGTTSIITGDSSGDNISIRPKTGENGILLVPNSAVTLYHDDSAKLATSSTGVTVTGSATFTNDVKLGDFSTEGTSTTGCFLQNEGIIYVQRVASSSEQVFSAWAGTTKNVSIDANGSATFAGNVSVGGVLTYEDVTNIDSVGIVTARSGINVTSGGANIVGVVTATTIQATTYVGVPEGTNVLKAMLFS